MGMSMTTIQFPVQHMTTVELVDHLTSIFLDIVLPVVVLWIGYSVRQWLPKEAGAHQQVSAMVTAVDQLVKEARKSGEKSKE